MGRRFAGYSENGERLDAPQFYVHMASGRGGLPSPLRSFILNLTDTDRSGQKPYEEVFYV